ETENGDNRAIHVCVFENESGRNLAPMVTQAAGMCNSRRTPAGGPDSRPGGNAHDIDAEHLPGPRRLHDAFDDLLAVGPAFRAIVDLPIVAVDHLHQYAGAAGHRYRGLEVFLGNRV